MERLRQAGIAVECGVLEEEARSLNIGFVSRMTRGRPWVRMKIAASLDGRTALPDGRSQWITGEAARRDAHHWRARACAILTGIGTVREDDPRLTVRHVETPRQPLRVVVDSRLETPESARVLAGGPVLIACARDDREAADRLRGRGSEVLCLPNPSGKVDLPALFRILAERGINEVLVEAGTRLNGSLLDEALVDELLIYLAPCLLGDAARGVASLPALEDLSARLRLRLRDLRLVGEDLRLLAEVAPEEVGPTSARE
jgi:diaminohydroxyphosphoribosylaminopyrimidine deaminase/5-amino-6-(5-phosphoribosylamino)uracil reductase